MKYLTIAGLSLVLSCFLTLAGHAHEVGIRTVIQATGANGSTVTYSESNLPANAQVTAVTVTATYSTGETMANGQIHIYAPGAPDTPWQVGTLNAQGAYTFRPDLSRRGRWLIRVEADGHSNFINLVI